MVQSKVILEHYKNDLETKLNSFLKTISSEQIISILHSLACSNGGSCRFSVIIVYNTDSAFTDPDSIFTDTDTKNEEEDERE